MKIAEIKAKTDEIFSISYMLQEFCEINKEIEAIQNINPIIEILVGKIDELNAYFINRARK